MAIEIKKMDDDEIKTAVKNLIHSSTGYYDSNLSSERSKVLDYYHGKQPKPHHEGNSKYVSMDVYDSVESLKAVLLETFSAGNEIIQFAPQGQEDVYPAKVATAYLDYVLFRQNDSFRIFSDCIHDGLLARMGIVKVWWKDDTQYSEEDFNNVTEDELDAIMADPDVEPLEIYDDEEGLSGTVRRAHNKSKVCIENIAPEEFLVDPKATDIQKDAIFCAHRMKMAIGDLLKMGYDKKILDNIPLGNNLELDNQDEVLARMGDLSDGQVDRYEHIQDIMREVMYYECYVKFDPYAKGYPCMYKICYAGNTILHMEEIDRIPFHNFVPLPVPHQLYGSNFANKLIQIQNARTVLTRGIIDSTVMTNNPRYVVTKGALTNPRELLDNRLGGIVNVTRPDGIIPFQQASLNPFVFQTIQMLDSDKEQQTGTSQLSQGLNKDAISKQNSQAMVEQLVTLSQQRQKIIARHFANDFLKPLAIEIYRLVLQNEDQQSIVELAGMQVPVDTRTWIERKDATVDLKLGYAEKEKEAQKILGLYQLMAQDPELARSFGPQNRYLAMRNILELNGVKNVDEYLTPPDQQQPPQPDPAQQMQMQMAQMQMQLEERKVALDEQKAEMDAKFKMLEHELKQEQFKVTTIVKNHETERKDFEAEVRAQVAKEELDLAKKSTQEQRNVIVSPNS